MVDHLVNRRLFLDLPGRLTYNFCTSGACILVVIAVRGLRVIILAARGRGNTGRIEAMNNFRQTVHVLVLAGTLLLLLPRETYAYIDPGTGSYILQIVLAAFLGALFALKIFWGNVKSFFAKLLPGRQKQSKDDR